MAHETPLAFEETLRFKQLERAYAQAVSVGEILTGRTAEEERIETALRLMAEITVHVPLLRLLIGALDDEMADGASRSVMAAARRLIAGVVRLGHRALEVHARDVGYPLDAWRAQAITRADAFLALPGDDDDLDELDRHASVLHHASSELAVAIAAVPADRMAVPTHLASALAAWLALFVRATRRLEGA